MFPIKWNIFYLGCFRLLNNRTENFATLEPRNPDTGKLYIVQKRRKTDGEAPKLFDRGQTKGIPTVHLPQNPLIRIPETSIKNWEMFGQELFSTKIFRLIWCWMG